MSKVSDSLEVNVLTQASGANALNLPYKPTPAFVGVSARFAASGLFTRGIGGGFWLSEAGRRELTAIRAARRK